MGGEPGLVLVVVDDDDVVDDDCVEDLVNAWTVFMAVFQIWLGVERTVAAVGGVTLLILKIPCPKAVASVEAKKAASEGKFDDDNIDVWFCWCRDSHRCSVCLKKSHVS